MNAAVIICNADEEHLARVREARRASGLPITFAVHPFAQLAGLPGLLRRTRRRTEHRSAVEAADGR